MGFPGQGAPGGLVLGLELRPGPGPGLGREQQGPSLGCHGQAGCGVLLFLRISRTLLAFPGRPFYKACLDS